MSEPLVGLPGALCPPEIFEPMSRFVGAAVQLDPQAWLTGPGPWDIPSLAATVADDVRQRYARPVMVCGHATGGVIALQLAVTAPDTVAGLLLVNTGAHAPDGGDAEAVLGRVRHEWGENLRAAMLDRSFSARLDPAARARMLDWAATVPQHAVHDVLASQYDLDLTPQLSQVSAPTVVLHGARDRTRPEAQARQLVATIPGARLRLVAAGHTPVYEAPAAAAAAVEDLLQASGT